MALISQITDQKETHKNAKLSKAVSSLCSSKVFYSLALAEPITNLHRNHHPKYQKQIEKSETPKRSMNCW